MFFDHEDNRDDPVWTEVARLDGGRLPVAVLGATGSVGQRFVQILANHPWFEVMALTASERSAGKPYAERVDWVQSTPIPRQVRNLELRPTDPSAAVGCRVAFSALDASAAGPAEQAFAEAGMLVASNAKSHRMDPDVPLLVPEVNADHLAMVRQQRFTGGGAILTNPNCSTIGLVLALKPLDAAFGVEKVHVVSMQALSGAGLPGVPSVKVLDNLVPYIGGEEDKIETETRKILGRVTDGAFEDRDLAISATCNRVPVIDGHTLCVSVGLKEKAAPEDLKEAWVEFAGQPQLLNLPLAPAQPVHYLEAPDAPQPRAHRDLERGMAASVGRLRPCPLLDYKFVTLSHNTVRGAAGGSVLVAETAIARGLVPGVAVVQ